MSGVAQGVSVRVPVNLGEDPPRQDVVDLPRGVTQALTKDGGSDGPRSDGLLVPTAAAIGFDPPRL